MSTITEAAVLDALRHVQEPELGGDIVTRQMVKDLAIDGTAVAFTIELTTPACPLKDEIEGEVNKALHALGATDVAITWGATVRRASPRTAGAAAPERQEHHRRRVGQGRRRQEHGQRQPGGRAGAGRGRGRACWTPTSPARTSR